jgi:prevent-host-death family protein
MVNNMTMFVVNIAEAKAKLSEFVDAVAAGERVLICKRNRPIAELRAVESARSEPRPIGLARGRFAVPDSFFEPLPDDVTARFYRLDDGNGRSRAAEEPPADAFGGRPGPAPRPTRRKGARARTRERKP